MKHRLVPLVGWVVALAAAAARGGTVEAEVDAVLQHHALHRATLAVQVLRLGNGPGDLQELFARNAHLPLVPASNLKLVTTAAALERLGADFKFRTVLLRRDADLVLIGDGDPTFGDAAYLKKVGWRSTTVYEGWAAQLRKTGVTEVRDVVVDDGVFEEASFHPDWPTDQIDYYYEAQVGGMNFNANLAELVWPAGGGGDPAVVPATKYLQIRQAPAAGRGGFGVNRQAGSNVINVRGDPPAKGYKTYVTVHDPALYAATVLADLLSANGVKVTGQVRRDRTVRRQDPAAMAASGKWPVVGIHETPIAPVLARCNKDSMNLYAEALCKRMGHDPTKGTAGSWETGTAATAAYLKSAGIPDTDFTLADGSGMSKRNAVSPRALARVLCYEYYGRNRDAYVASLSVAGVDGTLDDRFKGSDLRQRVFGKSGFVEGVSTLGGYLKAKDGQWYAFSIMVNGIGPKTNGEVKLLQERIVKAVDAEVGAGKR